MTHSVTKAVLSAVLSAAVAIPALAAENTQDENNIVPRMRWDCKGVFAGGIALQRSLYDLGQMLFLPSDGNLVDRLGRYGFMFITK